MDDERSDRCTRIQGNLARSLVELRSVECDQLEGDAGERGRLATRLTSAVDLGLLATEEILDMYPPEDDLAGLTFFVHGALRAFRDEMRRDAGLDDATSHHLAETVSSVDAGLGQLAGQFASRELLHVSSFGPSALVRELKNRQALGELRRLLSESGRTRWSLAERARLVGNGIAKLMGSPSHVLLPIAPRMMLRTIQRRIHAELSRRAVESPVDEELAHVLSDCAAAVQILFESVNTQLKPHDHELVTGALEFLRRGDVRSARPSLDVLKHRSIELYALLETDFATADNLAAVLEDQRMRLAPRQDAEPTPASLESWLPVTSTDLQELAPLDPEAAPRRS